MDEALHKRVEQYLQESAPLEGEPAWHALGEGVGGRRWRLDWGQARWFVKSGDAEILAAEADGLGALAATGTLRVPRVLTTQAVADEAYLLLEWLPLVRKQSASAARLGETLAALHLQGAPGFGWPRHNFIGATPQFNTPGDDWAAFFRNQRLGFQLRLAAENGYRGALQEEGARLADALPKFFAGYTPRPALLHGDLWGGNRGVLVDEGPVVFDPAVYHGDREADLAMTELFGGFDGEFYAAYRLHAPLDAGYGQRRQLYNLYHVLNHLNLFGGAYLDQASSMIKSLLAELG
jgi:fructosamine-3-kinase